MRSITASSSPNPSEGRRRLLLITFMKVMVGLVFLGWLTMWIMMPTQTYRNKWSPKITAATDSTFLGKQGTRILIFTFPILFIAVCGCVYLHLAQERSHELIRNSKAQRLKAWKRPVIVKGPLGVLSAMELMFCFQFLALIVWSFSMFLSNDFSKLTSKSAADYGEKLWEAKLYDAGVYLGLAGNICIAFLFFPVTRMSSLLPLIGLTSESSIKYHIWLGHLALTLFSAHGLCFIVSWASSDQISEMLKWDLTGVSNVAGEIALATGLVMWAATLPRVRRKMFELFFYTHHLYFIFLIFFLLHVGISFFSYVLPGIYLFLVDRYLRFLQSRRRVKLLSARLLPSEVVELNFAKSPELRYAPTSVVFINIPSISWIQWHPFTVISSSNLEPDVLSVLIKKEGSWTQKLCQTLSHSSLESLPASVEGPYSPVSFDFLRYDSLILVSGGSGITPFISIIRDLVHKNRAFCVTTPSILLLCSFKSSSDLRILDLLLPQNSSFYNLNLCIEAFITREQCQSPPSSHPDDTIQSLCFKSNSSAAPLYPLLGPNAWLYLAAIVSSSFVAFLLLIGLLTRYYIFPIDHGTDEIYSYAKRSMLNLLFLCFCIAMAASGAVLWNKRRLALYAKQRRVTSALTPMTSPSSWTGGDASVSAPAEIEGGAESRESVWRVTNLHYGSRPDLKKILLEQNRGWVKVWP
ncbi:Ferric reduction oxidase 2 [Platanthera zijinensis]|uniref:Ferric reduction oxidase 2 n=1 Tax=Platanthera zijinensis TaxID=2320716 RepID=A0AAP0AVE0_9ASPA